MFRRAILSAAADVFVERGFYAARIQDIASHARIGVGTVYNHFEQKEDVLHALLEEHTLALGERFAAHPDDRGDFAARLELRLARVLDYKDQHRAFFVLVMEYGLLGPTTGASAMVLKGRKVRTDRLKAEARAMMDQGRREGALRSDFDAEHLLLFFGGVLRAFAVDTIQEGATFASRASAIVDFFLHGAARSSRVRVPTKVRSNKRGT